MMALQGGAYDVLDLGWVDFDFNCSILLPAYSANFCFHKLKQHVQKLKLVNQTKVRDVMRHHVVDVKVTRQTSNHQVLFK